MSTIPAMPSISYPLVLGAQFTWPFTYKGPTGAPVDLTGYHVKGKLSWNGGSLDLTEGNGRAAIDVDPTTGKFALKIEEADTAGLPPGPVMKLSVSLIDPLGDVQTLAIIKFDGIPL